MYSQRHSTFSISSTAFWDFCIDNLASSDIPLFVSYILDHTRRQKLPYVGFRQGFAQYLEGLITNKELNDKLMFLALAPIMRPRDMHLQSSISAMSFPTFAATASQSSNWDISPRSLSYLHGVSTVHLI